MFSVDEKCVRCGLCSELCPAGIIKKEGGAPSVAAEDKEDCIRCGQCVSFCPAGACYLSFQPIEDRAGVDARLMPSPESAEILLRSRRSVRRFKEEPLPREVVLRVLETARYAPTGANKQEVRWVISQTREKTKEIAEQVIECFRRDEKNAAFFSDIVKIWDGGYDIITRGAPSLALALTPSGDTIHADGAIALTYLELAAYANGVGCCWAGFVTIAARGSGEFRRFIGVRDDETVSGGQMMGFPASPVAMSRLLPPRKKVDVSWIGD